MLDIWNEEDCQDEWWDYLISIWQDNLEVIDTQINLRKMI